jgi:hypothetical protein
MPMLETAQVCCNPKRMKRERRSRGRMVSQAMNRARHMIIDDTT